MFYAFSSLPNRVSPICQRTTESHQCRDGEGGGYPLSGTRLALFVFLCAVACVKSEKENDKKNKAKWVLRGEKKRKKRNLILFFLCRHAAARHSVV